jgi:transcriptional regulator with XRE-family HTH domain
MAQRFNAGNRLRATREELGMSLRDVQRASGSIAKELHNRNFSIPSSRLHFYETSKSTPSIYRLYTLARLYGRKLTEVLSWYGVPAR